MDIGDSTEFRNRLVVLAEVFDVKLSPQRQALYFEGLRDLPFAAVAKSLNRAVQTCQFFPKPAELRSLAVGDAEQHVEAAWMLFKHALSRVGAYSSLVVSDPVLGETIRALGGSWPEACVLDLSPEMWASKRKEFGRMFRVFHARELIGARYLPGICESQNSGNRDWARFTPVAWLGVDGIRTLSVKEAEAARTQIAAEAHGFRRLGEGMTLPGQEGQSA